MWKVFYNDYVLFIQISKQSTKPDPSEAGTKSGLSIRDNNKKKSWLKHDGIWKWTFVLEFFKNRKILFTVIIINYFYGTVPV